VAGIQRFQLRLHTCEGSYCACMNGVGSASRYTESDAAGNAAEPVFRRIHVRAQCSIGEHWCVGLQACSFKGQCWKSAASLSSLGSLLGSAAGPGHTLSHPASLPGAQDDADNSYETLEDESQPLGARARPFGATLTDAELQQFVSPAALDAASAAEDYIGTLDYAYQDVDRLEDIVLDAPVDTVAPAVFVAHGRVRLQGVLEVWHLDRG
jgi:hypothetical protein